MNAKDENQILSLIILIIPITCFYRFIVSLNKKQCNIVFYCRFNVLSYSASNTIRQLCSQLWILPGLELSEGWGVEPTPQSSCLQTPIFG